MVFKTVRKLLLAILILCCAFSKLPAAVLAHGDIVAMDTHRDFYRINPSTGSRELIFANNSVPIPDGYSFEDYLGLSPDGHILISGTPFSLPNPGPTAIEIYKLNPADNSATRLTRFSESALDFNIPFELRDPLRHLDRNPLVEPSGSLLLSNNLGDTFYRINESTGDINKIFEINSVAFPPEKEVVLRSGRIVSLGRNSPAEFIESNASIRSIPAQFDFAPESFVTLGENTLIAYVPSSQWFQILNIDSGEIIDFAKLQGAVGAGQPDLQFTPSLDGSILIAGYDGIYRIEEGADGPLAATQIGGFASFIEIDTFYAIPEPTAAFILLLGMVLTPLAHQRPTVSK